MSRQTLVWQTFDYRPRFNNNYVGLRNRFAILSEAYAYATVEERILASLYFVEEIIEYAEANARLIRDVVAEAEGHSIAGEELTLQLERFMITSSTVATREFQGHNERTGGRGEERSAGRTRCT